MNETDKTNEINEIKKTDIKEMSSVKNKNSVEAVKKKQIRNLILASCTLLGILFFLYYIIKGDDKAGEGGKNEKDRVEFASAIKHIDAGSIIIEKTEARLAQTEKTTEVLQKNVDELNREKEKKEQESSKEQERISTLVNRIEELEKKLNQDRIVSSRGLSGLPGLSGAVFPSTYGQQNGIDPALMTQGIREDAIVLVKNLENTKNTSQEFIDIPAKNPKDYVPSGTFVKAIALGGADASAAVNAQSNPQPMLFRIIEEGTMPNNKKSHLKGCLVTAAVAGDISSERGFIRLETLSCVETGTNKVIDLNVEGTVFGPEGKNGIRGIPMWREGALLQRAFAAGALSGISSGITQKYTQTSISPLGSIQSVNTDTKDLLKYGVAGGIGNAMEKLADYNIRRAEQYHPVLQLSAGTMVDIVFLKGFYFDDSTKNDATQRVQKRQEMQIAQNTQDTQNTEASSSHNTETGASNMSNKTQLPFTAGQIEKLKEREAELKE